MGKRKFRKQAARSRRTFTDNWSRAMAGLDLAVLSADEPAICRPAAEITPDQVARLRTHLEIHENDGDARRRYQELTGLLWLAGETSSPPAKATEIQMSVGRGPELIGFGGGQWGNCEVYIPGEEQQLAEEEWLILAQAAEFRNLWQ